LFVDDEVVLDRISLSDPVHMRATLLVRPIPIDPAYERH
jgi:hypothetical protein